LSSTIPIKNRQLGLYIVGIPGQGKSTTIQHFALNDIRARRGVAVIDPAAELIDGILKHIPEYRARDTILFESDNPVPIDFFSYKTRPERALLIEQLIDAFSLDHTSAPRAAPHLQRILGTLLDANANNIPEKDRCTFFDVHEFILDKDRRNTILDHAGEARQKQWHQMPPIGEFGPILTRLTKFVENDTLRAVLEAKRPRVNIADIIEKKQILLVKLQESEAEAFLGALIVAKIRQALFLRRDPTQPRPPFYVYIDECHQVIKANPATFASILLGGRKFGFNLTLANQLPSDLENLKSKIRLLQNVILLKTPPDEVAIFKDLIPPYTPEYISHQKQFHGLLLTDDRVYRIKTPPKLGPTGGTYAQAIRKRTHLPYPQGYACNPTVPHDESTTPVATPNDGISSTDKKDGGGPNKATPVPTYKNQTKGVGTPR